jgi:hypothetical protein
MVSALELVASAVDELRELDLDSLTDGELHDLAVGLYGLGDRLTAATAPLLDRWQHSGVWALDGSKSAAARFARETLSSQKNAHATLRRAISLATMPVTAAAAVSGRISLDQVDLLVRANTTKRRDLFAEHEQVLVDEIAPLRHREATRVTRYWAQRADAALGIDDTTAAEQHDANTMHLSPTLDDMVDIRGLLDPVSGAVVTTEIDRLAEQLRHSDLRDGIERTPAQRRAAALVEMATRSASAPADGRRPRPLLTALVGEGTLANLCELANGTVITPAHLEPFLTDALLETVLFDGRSTVVSVSRRRTFTGALRRAIEVRDRHCQHPAGCDVPADRCDVDHIVPAARGGPTSQANGRLQCATHNRNAAKHDHDAQPRPDRTVTVLDEIRATIRWRMRHEYPDEMRNAG